MAQPDPNTRATSSHPQKNSVSRIGTDTIPEHRRPVRTLEDLLTLDVNEIREGVRDAMAGEPCGDNRSRAFWHGWTVGMQDAGMIESDDHRRALEADAAPGGKMDRRLFDKVEREVTVEARERSST